MSENEKDPVGELYTEYGKFITKFEHVCKGIRWNVHHLINPTYNKDLEMTVHILLEGLAAKAQMDKYFILFMHKYSPYKEMAAMAKKVKNAFVDGLVPIRNSLSHGLAWPGQPASPIPNLKEFENFQDALSYDHLDYKLFSLEHHKLSASGFNRNMQILSIDNLKDLNERMKHFNSCFFILRHFNEYKDLQEEYESYLKEIDTLTENLKFSFKPLPNFWGEYDEF